MPIPRSMRFAKRAKEIFAVAVPTRGSLKPRWRLRRKAKGFGIWDVGFGMWDLGFGIWDLGFGIWDLGFGIWDSGFGIRDSGFGIRDSGFGIRDSGFGQGYSIARSGCVRRNRADAR